MKTIGILKRLGIVISVPIWIPAVIVLFVLYVSVLMTIWPFYWIITGRNDFEDRFVI